MSADGNYYDDVPVGTGHLKSGTLNSDGSISPNFNIVSEDGTPGAALPHSRLSTNDINLTVVKASPGIITSFLVGNVNSTPCYLKLYDKASNPDVNIDIPKWRVMIPGNPNGSGVSESFPKSLKFLIGIAYVIVIGPADTNNAPVGANDVTINIAYK